MDLLRWLILFVLIRTHVASNNEHYKVLQPNIEEKKKETTEGEEKSEEDREKSKGSAVECEAADVPAPPDSFSKVTCARLLRRGPGG